MIWTFNDGTVARLGGEIEGGSLFAQELRAELANDVIRAPIQVPGPGLTVDRNNAQHFDYWLRHELSRPYRKGIRITAAPDIKPLQFDVDEQVEGVLY